MSENDSLIPWIGKTGRLITMYIDAQLRQHDFDLTVQQWLLLKLLDHQDGQMQNDLALCTGRNKASLARLIATLESKDFVSRRVASLDRRAKHVFITKTGRKIYRQTLPVISRSFEKIQEGISAAVLEKTNDVLSQVQQNIDLQLFANTSN